MKKPLYLLLAALLAFGPTASYAASAKVTAVQTTLNNGEISPSSLGRFDVAKYANSLKKMENFLPHQLGGASFRPGTRYVGEVKDSSARTRLIPFQFNTAQAYILELGDEYMRFFANQGQVIVNASPPLDAQTVFLSHFDGPNGQQSYTAETDQELSFVGTAKIDTTQSVFGTSSLRLSGAGDKVTAQDSANYDFGTADFTIDMWVKFSSIGTNQMLIDIGKQTSGKGVSINVGTTSQLEVVINGVAQTIALGSPLVNGRNYHIEVSRNSTTAKAFLDGVEIDSWANSANITGGTGIIIGASDVGGYDELNGWIDELRISKGIARHTSGFTPPTQAYGGAANWATSTAYVIGDYVLESGTVYLCTIAHTSGTFSTDLAADKWAEQSELEVVTPWSTADNSLIHYAQNADTMYLFHPNFPTQKLQRQSATEFTLIEAPFIRGPFLDDNITAKTITPSAATGTGITLTASAATFEAGHVGSLWKVNTGVVKITGFTSTTVVTGDVQAEPNGTAGTLTGTSAYTSWAEGAFSAVRGYPRSGTFYGQRLVCGGTTHEPQKFFATNIAAYDNFKTDASNAAAAYTYQVASEQLNAIRWLAASPGALQLGTSGGTTSAAVSSGTITNTNVPEINVDTNYGTLPIQPKRISSLLYFVQKNGYNLREISYNYLAQRNFAADMNIMADHILRDGGGAYTLEYQQSPQDRLWVLRNDGQIAVLTRNMDQEVMGWARIIAGSDAAGQGMFESIAVIQTDEGDDEVWVIVKRTINGTTKRYVEYFLPESFDEDWDSVNVDSSLTLDSPITITGATKANPVVVTAPAHGFSNGDQVKIDNVSGMTDLNGNSYLVANKTATTFELTTLASANVNGTSYGTYASGGEVRKMVTAITGLSHLNGETVTVQADGAALSATYTVSGGSITLASKAAVVHVGLPYEGEMVLLKPGDANTQFKNRRFHLASFRLNRSLGFQFGQEEDSLADVELEANDGTLFTGDQEVAFPAWWDKEPELIIRQEEANPLFILAISLRSEVSEPE